MAASSHSCAPAIDDTQTRRFMTCLETLTESLQRSIEDPDLHKTLIGVLLNQVTPIVHNLRSARETNAGLMGEINYLREKNVEITNEINHLRKENENLKTARDQMQQDVVWFKQRFDESQKAGEELLQVKGSLEAKLSETLARERHLLGHIPELGLSPEVCMEQVVGWKDSHSQLEFNGFSRWINQSTEDFTSSHQDGPAIDRRGTKVTVDQLGGGSSSGENISNFEGMGIGVTLEKDCIHTDKSDLRSDVSIFTDAIKNRRSKYKLPKSIIISEYGGSKNEAQSIQLVNSKIFPDTGHSPTVKSDTHSKKGLIGVNAECINIGTSLQAVPSKKNERTEKEKENPAKPHTNKSSHSNNRDQDCKSSLANYSPYYSDLINTTKDNTRYADLAGGDDVWRRDSDTDSINPEFCVADPNEVAGSWNDVPAPLELLQNKTPEKHPTTVHDCPRSVKLLRLPPKITTAMVSEFVRGGKVTNILIITDKKKSSVKQGLITFLSPKAARNFHNWVQEFPGSLMIDGLRCLSSIRMSAQPPTYDQEVRVLNLADLPKGVDSKAELQKFVRVTTLEKARRQVPVEEITFYPPSEIKGSTEIAARVVFEVIEDAILMKKYWEARWGLKVQWGHDQCEEPLLKMDPMRKYFWFHKPKKYSSGSD